MQKTSRSFDASKKPFSFLDLFGQSDRQVDKDDQISMRMQEMAATKDVRLPQRGFIKH